MKIGELFQYSRTYDSAIAEKDGFKSGGVRLQQLLQEIDDEYEELVKTRRLEEVLYD